MADNVIWSPQPRQEAFMSRGEDEALYGGAAGGGKSDAMVIEALRQVDIPHYKGLILRKTFPQLSELIEKSLRYYPLVYPGAKYNESTHTWKFPSGAKIIFGSMQHTKDKLQYQGKAYDFIGFDELTHFTLEEYIYLVSRNRPNGPGTRCYMRATANPGGIGHGWVKERFITVADPMTTVWEKQVIQKPDGTTQTTWMSRVFVPATVFDNQKLLDNDPNYLAKLASMPRAERDALLYGDWDSFAGSVFEEFKARPDPGMCEAAGISAAEALQQQRYTHVIEPFDINAPDKRGWPLFRSYDFGYNKPWSMGYWTQDWTGTVYRIGEYYGWNGTPDQGNKMPAEQQFKVCREYERQKFGDRPFAMSIADPAIWNKESGESVAEIAARHGIYFEPADNSRILGWQQFHNRLQMDEWGRSRMYVFSTCHNWIRTVPLMMYSQTSPEDVDTKLEDHICDETRYFLMSRPIKPIVTPEVKTRLSDPLDQFRRR